MVPVVALVGRPNVGKSTLFNRLTQTRDALVADMPGLTRDRQYGTGTVDSHAFIVVDTGGLGGDATGIDALIADQVAVAITEAHVVVFLVDGREGLCAADEAIAERLRATGKPVILAVNKSEGLTPEVAVAEFHSLGLGSPHAVSAAHGRGITALMLAAIGDRPELEAVEAASVEAAGIRVAVVGRPNVGKSTLVNRMLGEDRVVVCDLPGTTRDTINIPFERDGQPFTLIDTAGVRRRARVKETVEKFSVIKALQAVEAAHVVLLVVDATEGVTEQDLRLLGHILEVGRALVVVINKWDGLTPSHKETVKRSIDRKFAFVDFAAVHFVSALHGSGVGDLFGAVERAYGSAVKELSTAELNRILEHAVEAHPPPLVRGRRVKLRYAHQGGSNPPVIVIHGNQTEHVPDAYRRYLAKTFRKVLGLSGTPVRIELKSGANPFRGRTNVLTERQRQKRRRGMRRVKKWK